MAFFGRYKSAPQLLDVGDNTYVIVGLNSPTEEEEEDEDENSKSSESFFGSPSQATVVSMPTDDQDGSTSLSGESAGDTTLQATGSSSASPALTITDTPSLPSPSLSRSISHSGSPSISPSNSPAQTPSPAPSPDVHLRKKTRPAPLPPSMLLLPASSSSPFSDQRHSYALAGGQPLRNSTDSDSISSEPHHRILFYQTSTDSGEILPESARGSNFPGELAGVDHHVGKHHHTLPHARIMDDQGLSGSLRSSRASQFPRDRSALFRIREAFRSPQVNRKRSKKDKRRTASGGLVENIRDDRSPQSSRLLRAEDALYREEGSDSPRPRGRRGDDIQKSPKARKKGDYDPSQDMSDWIIPRGYHDIELDHEFEVKRIPDYARYLSDLLEETDSTHPDYEDLSKAAGRVASMVKERENALSETDPYTAMEAVQGRFPKDDLRLYQGHTDIGAAVPGSAIKTINLINNNGINNNNNNNSTNNVNNNNNNINNDDNSNTTVSAIGSPMSRDSPQSSPNIQSGHLAYSKDGSDTSMTSPTTTPTTPEVEMRKDSKSNGSSNNSFDNSHGSASPRAMHSNGKHSNMNNNNEDKDAVSSSRHWSEVARQASSMVVRVAYQQELNVNLPPACCTDTAQSGTNLPRTILSGMRPAASSANPLACRDLLMALTFV